MTTRLEIDDRLTEAVTAGTVPHAVVVVADDEGIRSETCVGPRAVGGSNQIRADHVFRLASMTKVVTAVAAVQLRDRGALDLDAPVAEYRPEFAAVRVLAGFDGDRPMLRPPASRATVRQLLDHTAGFGYDFWHPELIRWSDAGGADLAATELGGTFAGPMLADPGVAAGYGIGYDWLGVVVEAVSGQNLAEYLAENVFEPLGMVDTCFAPSPAQRRRLVPVHVRDEAGAWIPTDIGWERRAEPCAGGHGLYTTPRDFLTFLQMLLGAGSTRDVSILQPGSAREMFADHTAGLPFSQAGRATARPAITGDFPGTPGLGWGWGMLVGKPAELSPRGTGEGGWAGIFNTYFWVDRRRGSTGGLFSQCLPFATEGVLRLRADVERGLTAQRRPRATTLPTSVGVSR